VDKPLLHRLDRRGVPFRTRPRAADPDPLDAGGGSGRPSTPPPPGRQPSAEGPLAAPPPACGPSRWRRAPRETACGP